MARPLSEKKRKAILDGALQVFAERGIAHAPTLAISRAAGVAEGSLFTYFKSKDELMNALYGELRHDFDLALSDYPYKADVRTRMRLTWDKFIDLGLARPERIKVMAQLRAAGRLLKDAETPGIAIVELMHATHESVAEGELKDAPLEFLVLLLRAQAEATVEFILVHPEEEAECREVGFKMIWKGLTGQ